MPKPIIIDCDPGIDDALAILLAVASEELDVKLITTCAGNQTIEKITNNALKLVSFIGEEKIEVAKGADKPLLRDLIIAPENWESQSVR
jgi:pyrimidine-specific ribonucleoside hydrolase